MNTLVNPYNRGQFISVEDVIPEYKDPIHFSNSMMENDALLFYDLLYE